MNPRRRLLLAGLAAAPFAQAASVPGARIRAVAFDGIALFDPRPVEAIAREIFPQQARELMALWRARQFEYTWLRTLMNRYADFAQVTEESLVFAARTLGIALDAAVRQRLVHAFFELRAWPDVHDALLELRRDGYRVVVVSNFTAEMMRGAIERSDLRELVDAALSTDLVRAYKPDPRAYAMSLTALGMSREEVCFVAFAGWDAAGAKAFGHPVYWADRAGSAAEELGVPADRVARDLAALPDFLAQM